MNPFTGMIELKSTNSGQVTPPIKQKSDIQLLQNVSEKVEEVLGSETDDASDNLSPMIPKEQMLSSPNTIGEEACSMGPDTLEFNMGKQKTFSNGNNNQSFKQNGLSQGSLSSPRLKSARKISTLNINSAVENGDQMNRDAIDNLNSVI